MPNKGFTILAAKSGEKNKFINAIIRKIKGECNDKDSLEKRFNGFLKIL
tara:strand:+ start:595 stop:741 length:147 start_codon:yes stop_codon:yes gene_type:complete